MLQGDQLRITYHSCDGSKTLLNYDIEEQLEIDKISIVKINNEFGFAKALGCIIGKST